MNTQFPAVQESTRTTNFGNQLILIYDNTQEEHKEENLGMWISTFLKTLWKARSKKRLITWSI